MDVGMLPSISHAYCWTTEILTLNLHKQLALEKQGIELLVIFGLMILHLLELPRGQPVASE
jgi:hypothetical protein